MQGQRRFQSKIHVNRGNDVSQQGNWCKLPSVWITDDTLKHKIFEWKFSHNMGEDSHFFTLNLYFGRFRVDSQAKWYNLTTFHTSRNLFWGCRPFSWRFSCRVDRGQMWMPRWRCWNTRSSWWSERTRRSCHPSEDSKYGPEKWKWYRIWIPCYVNNMVNNRVSLDIDCTTKYYWESSCAIYG